MLISKLFSKFFTSSEVLAINLPKEVWIHIWSFLDFNTCQKMCTSVSKEWLFQIRNSTRLSGEIILRLENRNVEGIKDALSKWPKLKILHLSDCQSTPQKKLVLLREKLKEFAWTTEMLELNLTEHTLLRKIVVPKSMHLVQLGDLGTATKVWFDPKNWTPTKLENVINLKINVNANETTIFEMMQIGQVLTNVEELYISGKRGPVQFDSEFFLVIQNFILGLKKLKKVWLKVEVDFTDILDFLHSINGTTNVKVVLNVSVVHDNLEEVEAGFEEGFKKFPSSIFGMTRDLSFWG